MLKKIKPTMYNLTIAINTNDVNTVRLLLAKIKKVQPHILKVARETENEVIIKEIERKIKYV